MKKVLAAAAIGAAVTLGSLTGAGTANATAMFEVCPSGSSGVIGPNTSCAFADVVAGGFYRHGHHFNALSPATGKWYEVNCASGFLAHFTNGHTHITARCFAGNNAQVVIW